MLFLEGSLTSPSKDRRVLEKRIGILQDMKSSYLGDPDAIEILDTHIAMHQRLINDGFAT